MKSIFKILIIIFLALIIFTFMPFSVKLEYFEAYLNASTFLNSGLQTIQKLIGADRTLDENGDPVLPDGVLLAQFPLQVDNPKINHPFPRYSPTDPDEHGGTDFQASTGDQIVSMITGKVFLVQEYPYNIYPSNSGGMETYGNLVAIMSNDGKRLFVYAHLSKINDEMKKDAKVKRGQEIGLAGSTGNSSGSHLHLELRVFPSKSDSWGGKKVSALDPHYVVFVKDKYSMNLDVHPSYNTSNSKAIIAGHKDIWVQEKPYLKLYDGNYGAIATSTSTPVTNNTGTDTGTANNRIGTDKEKINDYKKLKETKKDYKDILFMLTSAGISESTEVLSKKQIQQIPTKAYKSTGFKIRDLPDMSKNLTKMLKDLNNVPGVSNYKIISAYRTYEKQKALWQAAYNRGSKTDTARPGLSEHHLGTSVDISNGLLDNGDIRAGWNWLEQNCYKYGFILRYPKGKSDPNPTTGIIYEPWHFRYVGKSNVSKYYKQEKQSLSEIMVGKEPKIKWKAMEEVQ